MTPPSPIRATDFEARALAQGLLSQAKSCALGVIDPHSGAPMVTRIAFGIGPDGTLLTLVSGLAAHTHALRENPDVGLLIGDPGTKGDPLTHPRLSIAARAQTPDVPGDLRDYWLKTHPKSKLYIDLPDFRFIQFIPRSASLNAGFGRAFHLRPDDLNA